MDVVMKIMEYLRDFNLVSVAVRLILAMQKIASSSVISRFMV